MENKSSTDFPVVPSHVAIIGTGISGLSAAWLLSQTMRVTVYEAEARIGGHSNTVDALVAGKTIPVDTGFIVYNERNYPNLVALFQHLGVETVASVMSFAASLDGGRLEYSGSGIGGLFGQRRNIIRPRFWMMVRDILRFYKSAPLSLTHSSGREAMTLGEYLDQNRYSTAFIEDHLLPMGAAIWSMSARQMRAYPFLAFVRFFVSHGLLQLRDRPQWRTVLGGSREYVKRLSAGFSDSIRLNCPVVSIKRTSNGVVVTDAAGQSAKYSDVVIAAHADQALAMLSDPDEQERNLLSAFRYTDNRTFLHSDENLMPQRKAVWSSWNYIKDDQALPDERPPLSVTYWMNRLQGLPAEHPLFVTLNPTRQIDPERQLASFDYTHPLFDQGALAAQRDLWRMQGRRHTWFCGAYFGYGFHEDGLQAGLAVAEQLGGKRRPWTVENESGRIAGVPSLAASSTSVAVKPPETKKTDKISNVAQRSALFRGVVFHSRLRPRRHALRYRVFSLLLDLDELVDLDRRSRVFGYNRARPISFYEKDHGDGIDGGLRTWIVQHMHALGFDAQGMRFEILCYPRIFGYVFNPLTVYFCYGVDGTLRALLHEVCNTFGERHTYVIPVTETDDGRVHQKCAKEMYVSPFIAMGCTYHFDIEPPVQDRVLIRINEHDDEGLLLVASFAGTRSPLTDGALIRTFFSYPLMTVKAIAAIHWEALRLWLKKTPLHRHHKADKPIAYTLVSPETDRGHPHQ